MISATVVLRAMIDTMVFDRLVDDPEAFAAVSRAIREHRLALFTTPVQEAQLTAIPDRRRRKQLQSLPREVVPAPGDRAVYTVGPRHLADAMIADAAAATCDVLVTEDRRFTERAIAQGLEVWDVGRLLAKVRLRP